MANPLEYVEQAMAAFDEALAFNPEESAEAVAERRARQLMEEVA